MNNYVEKTLLVLTPMSSGTWMVWTISSFPAVNAGIAAITTANKVMALVNLIIVDRFEIGLSPAYTVSKIVIR